MGYNVESISNSFTFKQGTDLKAVLAHVKQTMFTDAALLENAMGGVWPRSRDDIGSNVWYSWTNTHECRTADSIFDIINQFFDLAEMSEDYMQFTVSPIEKIGQEDVLLKALAPFLEDGSHLYYRGEDGVEFGWRVVDGTLQEVTGCGTLQLPSSTEQ